MSKSEIEFSAENAQKLGNLISRSALLEELNDTRYAWQDYDAVEDALRNIPAVDAVVLPCKVGDTVWGIRNYKGINHPQQGKVDQMYYTNDMRLHIKIKHICIGEWGKKIFPTREEAEAALKERADK